MSLIECIIEARKNNQIPHRFRSADIKRVCRGFAKKTYSNFLPKHEISKKSKTQKYFKQNSDGTYSLLPKFRRK